MKLVENYSSAETEERGGEERRASFEVYHSQFLRVWPDFLAVFGRLADPNGEDFVDEIRLFEFTSDEAGGGGGGSPKQLLLRKIFELPNHPSGGCGHGVNEKQAAVTKVLFW